MKVVLTRIAAGLLLCFVALLAAVATLRLFLHGREVAVPTLAGLSDADAAAAARKLGLNLSVENRFYSAAVAPNHVLSQSPVAGSRVRRGWQVRVTESLGGQHVLVPDITGEPERPAQLVLRRLQLDVGNVAHLPAPSPEDVVLAQSPPPNTAGLSGPQVALLVSSDESASEAAAYIMPALGGMSVQAANARLATVGLHIGSATDPSAVIPPVVDSTTPGTITPGTITPGTITPGTITPATPALDAATAPPDPATPAAAVTPAPVSPDAIINSQSPAPGRRVTRGETIRVTVQHTPAQDDPALVGATTPLPQ
jgi:beta-lactam-binding protein with PASTA domain